MLRWDELSGYWQLAPLQRPRGRWVSFKRFRQEGPHGIPRAAVGIRVVRKASVGQINSCKRERMHGMAVAMKLPISFSLREFPGDCQHIIGRRERIFPAVEHENTCLNWFLRVNS